MTQQEIHEVEQGIRPPESVKMTLEEFLEHDVEGYKYIDSKLVPKSPPLPPEMCAIPTTMTPVRRSYQGFPVQSPIYLSNFSYWNLDAVPLCFTTVSSKVNLL